LGLFVSRYSKFDSFALGVAQHLISITNQIRQS